MKSVKKIFAVLLATAMIFAICAISVFATVVDVSTVESDDEINIEDKFYIYNPWNTIAEAEGFIYFNSNTRFLNYGVTFTNHDYEELNMYLLHAQCAVNYDDGTQDFFTISRRLLVPKQRGETLDEFVNISSGKLL